MKTLDLPEFYPQTKRLQFWLLQILGWGGLCVVTFLSLTVWYGTPNWSHVSHTIVQAVMGAILTLPLRYIYKRIWRYKFISQGVIIFLCVTLFSALWTALRMQAFLWLAEEYDIWKDFGGWYFGSFMVMLSWSAFYYGIKYYQLFQDERAQRLEEKLLRVSAESGARKAQMMMLRYQVNPHFLFNTLNSISALIKTQRADQAREMVSQLSEFMRYTLNQDQIMTTNLAEELEILHVYLEIERVRYGDRLQTEFQVNPDTHGALIPSMILQPLFENTIKYVISGTKSGGRVRLITQTAEGKLHITVEDTGHPDIKDVRKLAASLKKGIGLQNTEDRLKAHYTDKAEMKLGVSDLGGLKIELIMPFQTRAGTA